MISKPTVEELKKINFKELDHLREHFHFRYFFDDVGQEHYKLLKYISSQLKDGSNVFDIGTSTGLSALALSSNPNIIVHTYDIGQYVLDEAKRDNIRYYINETCLDDPLLLSSPFIFVDALKDTVYEQKIVEYLIQNKYKGVVMFDDIHLKTFTIFSDWFSNLILPTSVKKEDWSELGHVTGTGVIEFK